MIERESTTCQRLVVPGGSCYAKPRMRCWWLLNSAPAHTWTCLTWTTLNTDGFVHGLLAHRHPIHSTGRWVMLSLLGVLVILSSCHSQVLDSAIAQIPAQQVPTVPETKADMIAWGITLFSCPASVTHSQWHLINDTYYWMTLNRMILPTNVLILAPHRCLGMDVRLYRFPKVSYESSNHALNQIFSHIRTAKYRTERISSLYQIPVYSIVLAV